MSSPYYLLIQSFLTQFHKNNPQALFNFFSKEDEEALKQTPAQEKRPSFQINDALLHVHYSWLAPLIELYPEQIRALIASSLPVSIQENVIARIKPSIEKLNLSPICRQFFLRFIYHDLMPAEILPIEFLEMNPLNALLSLTKLQLVSLVDFLGIQDLAIDLRKIVDKKVLDLIKNNLSPHQKQYLDYSIKRADLPIVKQEHIQYWLQDKKKLAILIHQKGLKRLSFALADQNQHLVWHIIHRLDIGRGKELIKSLEEMPQVPKRLNMQIISEALDLAKLLKGGSK